jgi:methionine-rich copper-binding protein CopC
MTPTNEKNEEIRQYLLGNLSHEDQQRVEGRLMIESDFLEALTLGEEELLEDYLNDELSGGDRLRFEQHFLSTLERQKKLRFALAFNRYTSNALAAIEQATPSSSPTGLTWNAWLRFFWKGQTPAFRTAFAFTLLAIIAGVWWLARPQPPQTFATFTLSIYPDNRSEGAQAAKVRYPLEADALKLTLLLPKVPGSADGYRVELLTESGEARPLQTAGQDAQAVTVIIPAAQLVRGQYALRLFATTADGKEQRVSGNYFFTVE